MDARVGSAMHIDALAVHVTLGIDAWRIGTLERLACIVESGIAAREVPPRLDAIKGNRRSTRLR